MDVKVPLDVPYEKRQSYIRNFNVMTHETGRLALFAGDQKIEHMNGDFFGPNIPIDDSSPEHLFKIAQNAKIGAFASQVGLLVRYGVDYPKIPYVVKINSKTNLVKKDFKDPLSTAMVDIEQIDRLKKQSGLNIVGVGYTIYTGSEFEDIMLREAAQIIFEAHQLGLIAIIWSYPRGKSVIDEYDPHLVAGACGVAACLGADFVKVNFPKKEGVNIFEAFKEAVLAAGRTRVMCAGGSSKEPKAFLEELYNQVHISGVQGAATGRNIHQKPLKEAINFANAIYAVLVENKTVEETYKTYQES